MIKKLIATVIIAGFATTAMAASKKCEETLDVNMSPMGYFQPGTTKAVNEIDVPKFCAKFTIHLTNTDKNDKYIGHNIVISKADEVDKIRADGLKEGKDKNYLDTSDKGIVAHTAKMVFGGDTQSVTFSPKSIASGNYEGYCTWPGHTHMIFKLAVK